MILVGVIGAFSAISARAQTYGDHGWMWGGEWGWDHMIFGGLFMFVFWAAIIVLIVLAFRWLGGTHGTHLVAPPRTALDILKERYARGDIDKEEFLEKKRHLSE